MELDKPEIMVVDDQPAICKEVASYLKNDYIVHAFKDAKGAIKHLENNRVDLILLDYYMPEMTGFEALLSIQQNKATSEIPIVFLTAETSDRMEHEMLQRGAVDFLVKPMDATKLKKCISKHLSA